MKKFYLLNPADKFFISLTLIVCVFITQTSGQETLFDFDAAPVYTPFPIDQTVSGITAHFEGTGESYSIQDANAMGFTPEGFAGHCIYPGSVFLADLLISFDQTLTDFSIMYSCQELGCDDAATMRVTAFLNGVFVGTNTKVASNPGTWPVATLSCSFTSGFDSVVVHYDSPPPTCSDYGVIFMADNMRVTKMDITAIDNQKINELLIAPNPVATLLTINLPQELKFKSITLQLFDLTGNIIYSEHAVSSSELLINTENIKNGNYFYTVTGENKIYTGKIIKIN